VAAEWWVSFGTAVPFWSSSLVVARHLPHGRSPGGDRHLNFYGDRDNLRMAATVPFYAQPNSSKESSAPGRGLMPGGAGQLSSGSGGQGCGAGAVTAEPSWVAERSQAP
jgi:hypothetical protein